MRELFEVKQATLSEHINNIISSGELDETSIEMCIRDRYYSPQIWCSDDTDAVERLEIQEGTALIYPCLLYTSRCV